MRPLNLRLVGIGICSSALERELGREGARWRVETVEVVCVAARIRHYVMVVWDVVCVVEWCVKRVPTGDGVLLRVIVMLVASWKGAG